MKRTIDYKFSELCDEIDYWMNEAKHFESLYKKELQENNRVSNERMKEAQKGIANALMLVLSVKDDKEGNLIILKKDRKLLANNFR